MASTLQAHIADNIGIHPRKIPIILPISTTKIIKQRLLYWVVGIAND